MKIFISAVIGLFFAQASLASPSIKVHCTIQKTESISIPSKVSKLYDADLALSEENSPVILLKTGTVSYVVDYGLYPAAKNKFGFILAIGIGNDAQQKNYAYSKTTWTDAKDNITIWTSTDDAEVGSTTSIFCKKI